MHCVHRWLRAVLFAIVAVAGTGCASGSIPSSDTPAEREAECVRHGGWWHADELLGGYCEPNSQM